MMTHCSAATIQAAKATCERVKEEIARTERAVTLSLLTDYTLPFANIYRHRLAALREELALWEALANG